MTASRAEVVSRTSEGGSPETVAERVRRLSPLDAAFLYFERPNQLLHVACIAEVEGTVPFQELVETIRERLCDRLPRYSERPVRATLDLDRPAWEPDPTFDVRRQVRHIALPAPGGEAELRELIDTLFMAPLDRRHPLWEIYLIDGLANGSSVLFSKVHHCMIDGVSGAQIIELVTDPAREPRRLESASGVGAADHGSTSCLLPNNGALDVRPKSDGGGLVGRLGLPAPSEVLENVRSLGEAIKAIGGLVLEPNDPLPFNKPLSDRRTVAWTSVRLDDVLAIRGRAGCKANDVLLAIIAGGLRRYLEAHGLETADLCVRALVPVSVRRSEERLQLGNLVSAMLPRLPVGIADPKERLAAIASETQNLKLRGQPRAAGMMLALVGALPAPFEALLGRFAPEGLVANTICTNVPGPREVRYLLGHEVRAVHGLVPLFQSMGVEFALLSYAGNVSITATADPTLVPDLLDLMSAIDASARELTDAFLVEEAQEGARRPLDAEAPAPRVADLMTSPVICIRPSDSLLHAFRLMHARRIRHLPVLDEADRLVGLVTHRDVLAAASSSLERETVEAQVHVLAGSEASEVMETQLCVASPHEPASEAGLRMVVNKIGCLPVVDDAGHVVGIVTEEDFVRWATEHMASGTARAA